MAKVIILCLILPLTFGVKFNVETETLLRLEAQIIPYKLGCIFESGVSFPIALDYNLLRKKLQDNENAQCYLKCLAKRLGFYDSKNRTFVKETVMEEMGATEEVFQECSVRTEDADDCKIVSTAGECILQSMQLHFGNLQLLK
ncbi:uncharacterized protein LOC116159672 [Photinus pyralis]|uniref:uncharacterized protein LOC116159672 n=1 Tax=Photinus pyralis TaxID=7054 RepID=UPI00126758F4|nr:uncharacterized protein LOC116159672 [Photinus pyralis]